MYTDSVISTFGKEEHIFKLWLMNEIFANSKVQKCLQAPSFNQRPHIMDNIMTHDNNQEIDIN